MRPIYAADAQRLEVQPVQPRQPWDYGAVLVVHHHLGDNGEITDYAIQLTPHDARRLAQHLRKAARLADHPETQEANG